MSKLQMLTKSGRDKRVTVVAAYCDADLLGLQAGQSRCRALAAFVPAGSSIPHLVQSSLARLINAMASAGRGRQYLAHPRLVHTLLDCLLFVGDQLELTTVDIILATLQKLSLK